MNFCCASLSSYHDFKKLFVPTKIVSVNKITQSKSDKIYYSNSVVQTQASKNISRKIRKKFRNRGKILQKKVLSRKK